MGSYLDDSFLAIQPLIYSPQGWNERVAKDLETLSSLSTIDPHHKYYFDEKSGRFCKSSWAIADNIKGWIGDWAANWVLKEE